MTTYRLSRIAGAFACVAWMMMASAACDESQPLPAGPSNPVGPAVASVSPNAGSSEGASAIRIEGSRFLPGATVTMGGAATNVVVVNSTTITATTPAHAAGVVAVVVTNPDGKSSSLPAAFTFADLAVTSVAPAFARSGATVRILGAGFSAGATVTMGGVEARILSSTNSTIDVIAPDHDFGSVDVVVTGPGGRSVTLTGGFRFITDTISTVTISVSATEVTAGSELTVSWIVQDQGEPPLVRGIEDSIGLWNISTGKHFWFEELWEEFVSLGAPATFTGRRTLTAPTEPGQYEFRYRNFNELRNPSSRLMGRSSVITVTAAAPSSAHPLSESRTR